MKAKESCVSPHVEENTSQVPPKHHLPAFCWKGRRGIEAPQYYSVRSSAGHPDPVAEIIGAGRTDPEWMWLKLLCFICVLSTVGGWLFGKFFPEHIKVFKDEPWSPFDR